jgi:hypothetical protein
MKTNKKTLRKPKLIRKEEHVDYRMNLDENGNQQIIIVNRVIQYFNWKNEVVYEESIGRP